MKSENFQVGTVGTTGILAICPWQTNARTGPSLLVGGLAGPDSASVFKEAACGAESCDGHMEEGLRLLCENSVEVMASDPCASRY